MTGVRIELITTGSELLNGLALNRHGQTLGRELASRGYGLARDTTVGDDGAAIRDILVGALERADVVLMSGGLGPTDDDLTRGIVADLWGCGVVMDEGSRQRIAERYAARNKPLNGFAEQHALVVEVAEVLENRVGLAPGELLMTMEEKALFLLPGPPREFRAILEDHVLPWIVARHPAEKVPERTFQVLGPGESDVLLRMEQAGFSREGLEIAFCASPGRVLVTLGAGDAVRLEGAARAFEGLFSRGEIERGHESLEGLVLGRLRRAGRTVAVAESCTGGGLGGLLTSVPGASAVFRGGVIAYANEVKSRLLGVAEDVLVDHGAVSEPVARSMAEGARDRLGADYGISITGVAGPDGGTETKPVGLVFIGVAGPSATEVLRLQAGGDREVIRLWAIQSALNGLRVMLEEAVR
ncbi:MAG TPA: CinA family nicotinamide mononucleotide deamidase-related protein [Kiritimatiellia bacterium]|nr:CinA family nicotinamide mononucleotide deamidase-related protein [Kiritimatiellia bacterium]